MDRFSGGGFTGCMPSYPFSKTNYHVFNVKFSVLEKFCKLLANHIVNITGSITDIYIFFNCMFYQLLRVQHSCSSTQSWGSVLPSIVETRDQNSRGCPLLFSNRNLGSFCA